MFCLPLQLVQASFHDNPFSGFLLPADKQRKKLMGHLLVHTSAKFQICHEMQLLTVKIKQEGVTGGETCTQLKVKGK